VKWVDTISLIHVKWFRFRDVRVSVKWVSVKVRVSVFGEVGLVEVGFLEVLVKC
jgi:hypothetical protein